MFEDQPAGPSAAKPKPMNREMIKLDVEKFHAATGSRSASINETVVNQTQRRRNTHGQSRET
jgi:hypothetical protein